MHDINQYVGARLKKYREDAGCTQGEIADVLGVSEDVYRRFEEEAGGDLELEDFIKVFCYCKKCDPDNVCILIKEAP